MSNKIRDKLGYRYIATSLAGHSSYQNTTKTVLLLRDFERLSKPLVSKHYQNGVVVTRCRGDEIKQIRRAAQAYERDVLEAASLKIITVASTGHRLEYTCRISVTQFNTTVPSTGHRLTVPDIRHAVQHHCAGRPAHSPRHVPKKLYTAMITVLHVGHVYSSVCPVLGTDVLLIVGYSSRSFMPRQSGCGLRFWTNYLPTDGPLMRHKKQ